MSMSIEKYHPKITVITVVYNGVDELPGTIASVKAQTYQNIEYIIIDGGSTDGTLDVIRDNEECISKWLSASDEGIYDAMNKGIMLATGDFINFMNAGDVFNCQSTISSVFSEVSFTRDQLIYGGHIVQYPEGKKKIKLAQTEGFKTIPFKMPFCHQSLFVNRSLCVDFLFDTKFKIASDFNFVCDVLVSGVQPRCVNQIVACVSSGGVSDLHRADTWSEYREVYFNHSEKSNLVEFYYFISILQEKLKKSIKRIVANY